MATETINYGLIKPDKEDFYTVDNFNNNMELIDENMGKFAILEDAGESPEPEIPTDSDLLGGQPKSYFEALVQAVSERVTPIEAVYPQLSNPNLLINDFFTRWERGTSFITTSQTAIYTADRWCICALTDGVNNNVSVEKQADGCLRFSKKMTTSGRFVRLGQFIEMHKGLVGKKLTVSFKIKNYTNPDNLAVSAAFRASPNNFTLSAAGINTIGLITGINGDGIYKFTTSAVPSDAVRLLFMFQLENATPSGDTFVDFEWIKVEVGEIATLCLPRLYADELALCKRYYQRYYRITSNDAISKFMISICSFTNTGIATAHISIPEMRVSPIKNNIGDALQCRLNTGTGAMSGPTTYTLLEAGLSMITIQCNNANIVPTEMYYVGTFNSSPDNSKYLELDAEIY